MREKRIALKNIRRLVYLARTLQGYTHEDVAPSMQWDRANKVAEELSKYRMNAYEVLDAPESLFQEWADVAAEVEAFVITFHQGPSPEQAWNDLDFVANRFGTIR
jgi:hypothetical protein